MKTVIIWTDTASDDLGPKFVVLDGDHRCFDGIYINHYQQDWALLCDTIYGKDGNEVLVDFQDKFPLDEVLAGAFVISAGFIG